MQAPNYQQPIRGTQANSGASALQEEVQAKTLLFADDTCRTAVSRERGQSGAHFRQLYLEISLSPPMTLVLKTTTVFMGDFLMPPNGGYLAFLFFPH